jgi:hypothetical protein
MRKKQQERYMIKFAKFAALAAVVSAAALPASVAQAATANIPFNGSVANTCVITVGSSGTLAVNGTYDVLGSQQAGGSAGTATLLVTGAGFNLSADAPAAFSTAPATGNDNVTFEANYSASGANTIPQTDGATATALNRGNTSVNVNMSGTKTVVGETFEAGNYAATVVLRCE